MEAHVYRLCLEWARLWADDGGEDKDEVPAEPEEFAKAKLIHLGGPWQSVPVIAVEIDQDQDMQIAFNDPKLEQESPMDSTSSTYAPSPETPDLTYSPSSTESSSGDSTIQMSTLEANMFPLANASQLWLEQVDRTRFPLRSCQVSVSGSF
ncbi:hypothetical protein GALMADRAFT_139808 [Galerina marginata CBS 339.88]|uniref:Uncharacterized protein n=1 Tax=Galerina marginata (strain CBS 339.88) TaxID=685588 RepID=A0A067T171_GALM3|nr:hypothetical protein GALMADRAFT_139808 [Galerina marginata CBS 339.88]